MKIIEWAEKLRAIKARRAGALDGEWREELNGSLRLIVASAHDDAVIALIGEAWTPGLTEFILHAREDIDALIAEVENAEFLPS